uniref:Uncharacterized protein n=1 Tax=Arundo donax TaxID=35708 RepID=A0A0A9FHG5_ARUDO
MAHDDSTHNQEVNAIRREQQGGKRKTCLSK